MSAASRRSSNLLAMMVAGLLATAPAFAAKPDSPGQGKGNKGNAAAEQVSHPGNKHPGKSQGGHGLNINFNDDQRSIISKYFGQEFKRGNCPPGLAKKNNGCMPPGQAKKWGIGKRLPDDLIYYDLPGALLRELGKTPEGHKLIRVGADVLMITVGTKMVVDDIEDLTNL